MSSTATLVHTSSRALATRDAMARVAAASRIEADRKAAEARREAGIAHNRVMAQAWVDQIAAAGAVEIGTKVCLADGGKWRPVLLLDGAADSLARWIADGDDVEAWGVNAAGETVGEGL